MKRFPLRTGISSAERRRGHRLYTIILSHLVLSGSTCIELVDCYMEIDIAAVAARGSTSQTAHDDTQGFIRGLEMTARRILTKANKRRMGELRRQQIIARRIDRAHAEHTKKIVLEVPPARVDKRGNQVVSRAVEFASKGIVTTIRGLGECAQHHSLDDRDGTHSHSKGSQASSLPPLRENGSISNEFVGDSGRPGRAGRKLPKTTRGIESLTTFGVLSRATAFGVDRSQRPREGGGGSSSIISGEPKSAKILRTTPPPAKIDRRLTSSPLFSASMVELTKPPKCAIVDAGDALDGQGQDEEAPGGISNMRALTASKVLGRKGAVAAAVLHPTARHPRRKGTRLEGQGVTSWSSDDLRVKYRGEREREETYEAVRLQEQVAETLEQDYGQAVAFTDIDRHLVYALYYAQLERENTRCLLRASARNKMKRFITDVHTVWLTNLAHHPEFRRMATGSTAVVLRVEPTGVIGSNADENTTAVNDIRLDGIVSRRGLNGRRDTAAISASRSQIQSVCPELAFRQAVFYSSEPKSRRRADDGHVDEDELELRAPRTVPNIRLFDDNTVNAGGEGGESPKLPSLPPKAPTLTVFASERKRLAPCPKERDGRRSRDGGRREAPGVSESGVGQRSARGCDTIGASAPLSETHTRMISVRRFQPAATVIQGMIDSSPTAEEDVRVPSSLDKCSSGIGIDPGTMEATWIVSSYLPYDGSEAHVFIRDTAIKKAVGEALSAPSFPISITAGSLEAETDVRGRAKGLDGEIGGDTRLLVLRRGHRIPVLDFNGHVGGTILAVLEVFVLSCLTSPSGANNTAACTRESAGAKGGDGRSAVDDNLLEITAYPVLLGSPPHGRCRGRQRAILTVESLWQRRKRMHPDVKLKDSPPHDFPDWPRSTSGDYQTDSQIMNANEKWYTGVRIDGACEILDRDVQDPSEGSGGEVGGNDWPMKRVAETLSEDVQEDILRMVAFGPEDGLDCDDPQHGCRATPLLLRPPQSFEVLAGHRIVERNSDPNTGRVLGGAAALVDESIAEVLLSFVHLNVFGRGPGISLDGVPGSALEGGCQDRVRTWEADADSVESLSMRVSGKRLHTREEVPGTTAVGKMGVTFTYPQAEERTQPIGFFFRDTSLSSSDSVMVVVSLALDTPKLTPLVTSWERGSVEPETAPHEDVLGVVPTVMIAPGMVQTETVVSELDTRKASGAFIFISAKRGSEFCSEAAMTSGMIGDKVRDAQTRRLLIHRRDWPQIDEKGFRRYKVYELLEPEERLETLAFGLTKRATLPNAPGVCGRSTFHSGQRCVEQLCRKRKAKDYAYVSSSPCHRGLSDPGAYTVSCKHELMKALMRTGLESYNAEMARIAVEQERQAKAAALQTKLEAGKAKLAKRRENQDAIARSLARKADAQILKLSVGSSRSRRKWELRLQNSNVLETRGKWEKRLDSGGSIFYHCVSGEAPPEPFSWDPPECWEAVASVGAETVTSGMEDTSIAVVGEEANDELLSLRAVGVTQEPGGCAGIFKETSLALAARTYTDDEKVSLAVTRLAENEKLLEALAWRLGIPLADVRRDGREPRLARDCMRNGVVPKRGGGRDEGCHDSDGVEKAYDEEELEENREQKELGDMDEMSDSDGEHGNAREPPGPMPQGHSDLRRIRIAKRRMRKEELEGFGYKQSRQPDVPQLPLGEASQCVQGSAIALPPQGQPAADSLETQLVGMGWRRLSRVTLGKTFLEKIVKSRTQGPRPEGINTFPKPHQTGTTDPTMASRRSEEFSVPVDTMFVADVVAEHERLMHEPKRRMDLEELVGDDSPGSSDVDKLAAIGPQEFTSVERRLMALAENEGGSKVEAKAEEAKTKAVVAARVGNLEELDGLIHENLPIDSRDSNGNTLLMLAVQQGDKRLVKFLLRKGAAMNHQNMDGNTVLHYCYSKGRQDLGDYLKSKGADDSLLNSEGLTCYEGLQAQQLEAI